MYAHAAARGTRQRLAKELADFITKHEGFKSDTDLSSVDGFQHRREDFNPVDKGRYFVATDERRPQEHA
jgi:hypothetical protein